MEKLKTSNSSGIVIFIIVSLIIAGVLYFVFKKQKPKPVPETNIDKSGKKITWVSDNDFPLTKGSSGNRVKQLQAGLNILKNCNLAVDGKFGEKTLAALQEGFKVDSLSEANYNTYIVPNIIKINNEINKSHPSNKPASGSSTVPITTSGTAATNVNYIGKSVSASLNFQGFSANPDDDLEYVINDNQPINYVSGQFIGLVEKDDNGWLRCVRSNGSRVFVLKNSVKI